MGNHEVEELNKLVEMAENVFATVSELNSKITTLRVMTMVLAIVIYGSAAAIVYLTLDSAGSDKLSHAMNIFLSVIAAVSFVGSFIYLFQIVIKTKEYKRSVFSETQILHDLLDMVFEYKDHIQKNDLSYVENAILDIRLKRIKFSSNL